VKRGCNAGFGAAFRSKSKDLSLVSLDSSYRNPSEIPLLELAYKQYRPALRLVLSTLFMFNLNVHSS
jgi:hypothetical protein